VLRVRHIESFSHPELEPYQTMRQPFEHYRDRIFVAEGAKVVERLLGSDLTVLSALMPEDHFLQLRSRLEKRPENIDIYLADKRLLEQLTGFSMYQGLLACARIPPPVELDVAFHLAKRPCFLVALDGLANAENLGGVVRTAVAFGADALLIGETCAHPFLRRAVRASMGTIFDLPVVETASLADALRQLRQLRVRCIAAHPHSTERYLPQARLDIDCCVVLGSEGDGISPAVRDACDDRVAVPMQRNVDSLNVGSAAAVFLYEVWRQRTFKHSCVTSS
jgi:tRNA G18 (ribose-2'-O)-methylase SpoU